MVVDVLRVRACVPSGALSVGIGAALEARTRARSWVILIPFRRLQYDVEHPSVVEYVLTAVRIVQYVMEASRRLLGSRSLCVSQRRESFRSFGATELNELRERAKARASASKTSSVSVSFCFRAQRRSGRDERRRRAG